MIIINRPGRKSNEQIKEILEGQGYELFEMRQSRTGVSLLVSYAARKKDAVFTAPTMQALYSKIEHIQQLREQQQREKTNPLPGIIGAK